MQFEKDILLIDFETTDIDPLVAEPIQLAAILLDKETLEEKNSFSSFISADLSYASSEALKINGITQEMLASAPSPKEVAQSFIDKFGFEPILSSWVEFLDRRMLEKLLASVDVSITKYDYHYLDLWPIAYTYLLKNGYSGSTRSESMFTAFQLTPRGNHDALEDCRKAAEVFRKIMS